MLKGLERKSITLNVHNGPKTNPFEYISLMRMCIECSYVSEHINIWINLIFGYKQRGQSAKEARNLFMSTTYGDDMVINGKTSQIERETNIA